MSADLPIEPTVPVLRSLFVPAGLARVLAARYGLAGVHCRLIQRTIRDIYAVWAGPDRYILAIYAAGARAPAEIAAELDLLDDLHSAGLWVAPAVPDRHGARLWLLTAPEGLRPAVLFPFLAGAPLSRTPDPAAAGRLGQTLGRLHQLADARLGALPRPALDASALLDAPLAAFAAVVPGRPTDVAYLQAVAPVLRAALAELPVAPPGYGLIHGDVIPSNVRIGLGGQIGLLDFDFCGPGWRAYDLGTYMAEVAYWQASDAVAAAFLAGYEGVRPLAAEERLALPLFVAIRHFFSLGIPAIHVDTWGSAYLADRLIDALLTHLRHSPVLRDLV